MSSIDSSHATARRGATCPHTSAYVRIRPHTSAYISIRQNRPIPPTAEAPVQQKKLVKKNRSFQGVIPLAIVARCACAYFLVYEFIDYQFIDSYFLVCDFISR